MLKNGVDLSLVEFSALTVNRPLGYDSHAITRLSLDGVEIATQYVGSSFRHDPGTVKEVQFKLPAYVAEDLVRVVTTSTPGTCHKTAQQLYGRGRAAVINSETLSMLPEVDELAIGGLGLVVGSLDTKHWAAHSVIGTNRENDDPAMPPRCIHRPVASSPIGISVIPEVLDDYTNWFQRQRFSAGAIASLRPERAY